MNPFAVDKDVERKFFGYKMPDGRCVGVAVGPDDTRIVLERDVQEEEKFKKLSNSLCSVQVRNNRLTSSFTIKNDTARHLMRCLLRGMCHLEGIPDPDEGYSEQNPGTTSGD